MVTNKEKFLNYGILETGFLFYNQTESFYFLTDKPVNENNQESNFFLYFHAYDKETNLKAKI